MHHSTLLDRVPDPIRDYVSRCTVQLAGAAVLLVSILAMAALASWSASDPNLNFASDLPVSNWIGKPGAIVSDLLMQIFGLASVIVTLVLAGWGWSLLVYRRLDRVQLRLGCLAFGTMTAAGVLAQLPVTGRWPLPTGMGGVVGDAVLSLPKLLLGSGQVMGAATATAFAISAILLLRFAVSAPAQLRTARESDEGGADEPAIARTPRTVPDPVVDPHGEPTFATIWIGAAVHVALSLKGALSRFVRKAFTIRRRRGPAPRPDDDSMPRVAPVREGALERDFDPQAWPVDPEPLDRAIMIPQRDDLEDLPSPAPPAPRAVDVSDEAMSAPPARPVTRAVTPAPVVETRARPARRAGRESAAAPGGDQGFVTPAIDLLAEPRTSKEAHISNDALEQNARLLEGVLEDFGVRGEIINVRPGPVVTLYELEPAPGIKSSRVIGLADDIARSMSAISARVAVVSGRNAIGIELPNPRRETVYLRSLIESDDFLRSKHKLPICLGKTIGGESVITDLAKMPHLLVAGTTGSGKSVAINTMILSLLYRLRPDQCRLIMIDPKMLELSVYDGIPHLLTPVVTDPKKAIVALKWAVREMEDRYRKMSKLGVRNIEGFNTRVAAVKAKGEPIVRTVQTGFDRETGEPTFEQEELVLDHLPFVVIIVDEMADLMMVAGKDIEGAIQRLAQMARAAGIHLIMATQRPSVDVITGTIKANFPTRISFQVTSKIDSRTILGEQGAEQLLGQGDMLYMAGGGRISRVHGPFVSDGEVEEIVAHLKTQGHPEYLEEIVDEDEDSGFGGEAPGSSFEEESSSLYDRAVAIVLRDQKCSTSYIQRRLSIGYNKAASLVEQMEKEGVVSPANHAGKREILVGDGVDRRPVDPDYRN